MDLGPYVRVKLYSLIRIVDPAKCVGSLGFA